MKYDIFISYRRLGGRDIARTIQQALIALGFNRDSIFFDYNSLRDGVFNKKIIDAINECNDFILVLSKGSMDRCVNDDDWVAKEIMAAINAGCKIIPIRIDNQFEDFPADFPKKLGVLRNIQSTTLHTDEYFDDSIRHISERFVTKPNICIDKKTFEVEIKTDETCEVFLNGEHKHKIKGNKPTKVTYFTPGDHYDLVFKSLARKDFEIKIQYDAPFDVLNDSIDISFKKEAEEKRNNEIKAQIRQKAEKEEQKLEERKRKSLLSKYSDYSETLSNDRQLVQQTNGLLGYVNSACHELIPCQYSAGTDFIHGYAYVKMGTGWGLINPDNEIILPFIYDTCHSIVPGYAITEHNKQYKLFDLNQKKFCFLSYDEILPIMTYSKEKGQRIFSGIMVVKEREEYSFLSVSSNCTLPSNLRLNSVYKYTDNLTVLHSYEDYHKQGLNTEKLQYCFLPDSFQSKGKYGIINTDFKIVVPFIYDDIKSTVYNNRHIIVHNQLFGLVNSDTGEILIDVEHGMICVNYGEGSFLEVHDYGQIDSDSDSFRYINGKIAVYDYNGQLVIPQMYDGINIQDGFIYAKKFKDRVNRIIQTDVYSFTGELIKTYVDGYIKDNNNLAEPDWSHISMDDSWIKTHYIKNEYYPGEDKMEGVSEAPKNLSVLSIAKDFKNELNQFFSNYNMYCIRQKIHSLPIPYVPNEIKEIKQYPLKNYLILKQSAVKILIHFFINQTSIPNNLVQAYLKANNHRRFDMVTSGPLHDLLEAKEWDDKTFRYKSLESDLLMNYSYALLLFEKLVKSLDTI